MNAGIMDNGSSAGPPPFTWISTQDQFDRMVAVILPASRLAIDIEADSLYHYFEKVCLIQISSDSDTFVLDPLAVRDLEALSPILIDPGVEKVFHAASYDLHCLRRDYGFTFRTVFDTHLAALLLGYEQLGLDALLEKLLGVLHSKRRQRDDWSRRPLGPEQLEYAATDTRHLLQLRDQLERQLRERNRLSWAREEFQVISELESEPREFDPEGYRRIKGSRDLPLQQLAVLRALYLLRDRYARELDVPPFKVMNNSVLLDLARRPPASPLDMYRRPGVSYRVARRFSKEIHRTIEKARGDDPASLQLPARNRIAPPTREARVRLERLRQWRKRKAEELQLPVGVVFPGTLLEFMASFPPQDLAALEEIEGMRLWRAREFGPDIIALLNEEP